MSRAIVGEAVAVTLMKLEGLSALGVAALMLACASATAAVSGDVTPSGSAEQAEGAPGASGFLSVDGWPVAGKTTAAEVRARLGPAMKENHTDSMQLGQYVWMYWKPDHTTIYTILFDRNDVVVRMNVFAHPVVH